MEDELTLPDTGTGEPLPTLLREVLAMMPDGRYRLGMQASPDLDPDQPATDDAERSSGEVLAWTGLHRVRSDDPLLLGTVPRDLLDRAQIRALSARINRGARPPVVLVEAPEQGVSFIVAGHTALEAYRRVAMEPVLLTIEPLDPDPLSEDAGAVFAPERRLAGAASLTRPFDAFAEAIMRADHEAAAARELLARGQPVVNRRKSPSRQRAFTPADAASPGGR